MRPSVAAGSSALVSVFVSTLGLDARRPSGRRTLPVWKHTSAPGWRDAWLPVVLLLLGAAELASLGTRGWVASIGLEAVAALLLVFRRRLAPSWSSPLSALALAMIPFTGTAMDEAADTDPLLHPGRLQPRHAG